MNYAACLFFSLLLYGPGAFAQEQYGIPSSDAVEVSLDQLLASPDAYNGKLVQTYGLVDLNFEDWALFSNESDFKNFALEKNVRLHIDLDELGIDREASDSLYGKWVMIQAIFHKKVEFECPDSAFCITIRIAAAGDLWNIRFLKEQGGLGAAR